MLLNVFVDFRFINESLGSDCSFREIDSTGHTKAKARLMNMYYALRHYAWPSKEERVILEYEWDFRGRAS